MKFQIHIIIYYLLFERFIRIIYSYEKENCRDFQYISELAAKANLSDIFYCPKDGISRVACRHKFPMKAIEDIKPNPIYWNDTVILCLAGNINRLNIQKWWLSFLTMSSKNSTIVELESIDKFDFVIIGDACPNNASSCHDETSRLQFQLNKTFHTHINVHLIRALYGVDAGYWRIACKLVTGMKKTYELFPNKKYYVQIDDDTVIFPNRLLRIINTFHAVHLSEDLPVLIGTVLNDHKEYLLCHELGVNEYTNEVVRPNINPTFKNATPVCGVQGGAGYIMNNAAMQIYRYIPPCTKEMDLECIDGDTYVPWKLYRDSRTEVIHCGSFRPNGGNAQAYAGYAISFHHITQSWLDYTNVNDLVNKYHILY